MKRIPTGLSALVALDKPEGCTSHDVVARVRRATGERRVGHCGTLNPFASGVLLVCIGPATRLSPYLTSARKSYLARIAFGVATDTDDLEGRPLAQIDGSAGQAKQSGRDGAFAQLLDEGFARRILTKSRGTFAQVPPAYSAKKVDGRRAYESARAGAAVKLEPAEVTVYSTLFLGCGVESGPFGELPYWDVAYEVSKGTYIRSLARDLGSDLGCGAHLARLRRTSIGDVGLSSCLSLEAFEEAFSPAWLAGACLDPVAALGLPSFALSDEEMERVAHGSSLLIDATRAPMLALVHGERLQAIYGLVGREGPTTCRAGAKAGATPDPKIGAIGGVTTDDHEGTATSCYACETMFPGGVCGVRNAGTEPGTEADIEAGIEAGIEADTKAASGMLDGGI